MRSLPLCSGMCALSHSLGSRAGFNQIVAVAFRMRRGETDAFQAFDFVDGVEQLDKGGFFLLLLAQRGEGWGEEFVF